MTQPTPSVHIEILEPRDQAQVPASHVVHLRATASAGSETLDSLIRWRSNRDGFLGQGGDIVVELTEGKHKLRAAVRFPEDKLGRHGTSRSQTDDESQTNDENGTDSDDSAKDVVEVHAVPVDYPGGDT